LLEGEREGSPWTSQNEREKAISKLGSMGRSTSFILGHLGLMNLNYANIEEYKEPLSVKWFGM